MGLRRKESLCSPAEGLLSYPPFLTQDPTIPVDVNFLLGKTLTPTHKLCLWEQVLVSHYGRTTPFNIEARQADLTECRGAEVIALLGPCLVWLISES